MNSTPITSPTATTLEKQLYQLNWSVGPSSIEPDKFTPIEYRHLARFKPPFNGCSGMRVWLPKAEARNKEGDPIMDAIVEADNQHRVLYHATSTIEFTQNILVPELNAANIYVTNQTSNEIIIHP